MNDYSGNGQRSSGGEQRAILAIVLSLAVYWLWASTIAPRPQAPAGGSPAPAAEEQAAPAPSSTADAARAAGEASAPPAEVSSTPAVEPTPELPERTEPLEAAGWRGLWSSRGGGVVQLELPAYTEPYGVTPIYTWAWRRLRGVERGPFRPYVVTDEPVDLLTREARFAAAGAGDSFEDGDYRVVELSSSGAVFERVLPGGLRITKTYRLGPEEYQGSLLLRFENTGTQTWKGPLWVGISDAATGRAGRYSNVFRPLGVVDGSRKDLSKLSKVLEKPSTFEGPVSWLGFANRYFVAALLPRDPSWGRLVFAARDAQYGGAYLLRQAELAPGESVELELGLYAGPEQLSRLKAVGHGLEKAVRFGWFGFFARILLALLRLIHAGVGNWGLAIIGLTLVVKLSFFPLTQKAFRSAKEMQRIQPELNAIKEKYKDDKDMQTQETMRLFKEHGVNPFGGCLPTLIQLPVWIALYNVLLFSVDLYHSRFLVFLDLSEKDPYAVLPVLVGILYFLQQRMTPMSGMDPAQARMMQLMPLMFVFFIFSFPSGLALYILVNTLLTILQQWIINRNYQRLLERSS